MIEDDILYTEREETMAKDKQKQDQQKQSKPKRGEGAMMRALLRKAKHVAKSNGKPALEAYVNSNSVLKVYFAKDIARLMAKARTPKLKVKVEAATA